MINEKPTYRIPILLGLSALMLLLGFYYSLRLGSQYLFDDAEAEAIVNLLSEKVPYSDFELRGSFGLHLIQALLLKLFDIFLIDLNLPFHIVWQLATVIFLYFGSEKLRGGFYGLMAGIAYITFYFVIELLEFRLFHSIRYIILPLALTFYLYQSDKIGASVLSGIIMGLAWLINFYTLFLVVAIAIYSAMRPRQTWEPKPRRSKMFSFLYGFIIVFSMFILYLTLSGALDDFVRQAILL